VESARAVLLLGSESTENFEAALQVRLLNPRAQIVVRSSSRQANLAALLEERLPGMAVVDPLLLTAGAISEALRSGPQVACFQIDGQSFAVMEGHGEDRRLQRPLRCGREGCRRPLMVMPMGLLERSAVRQGQDSPEGSAPAPWRRQAGVVVQWLRQRPLRYYALLFLVAILLAVGIHLFARGGGWVEGAFVTLALLKGEFVDPVNVLLGVHQTITDINAWLLLGSLIYALLGTLLTSALVAVILEWLLRERFGPPRPGRLRRGSEQILLVEGGELGDQACLVLQGERQNPVRVDGRSYHSRERTLPVFGQLDAALAALRRCRVVGIGLLSPDLLANLQTALELQRRWPEGRFVVLAHAVEAAERLGELLGGVTVISSMDVAADALVATAFGERVEEVCRIDGVNQLLVRYRIQTGDTLCDRTVARVENGYCVTVMLLRRARGQETLTFPSPDSVLAEGDRLVVLGTVRELRAIERGEERPPGWCIRLQGSPDQALRFDALQSLARYLGRAPGSLASLLDGRDHCTGAIDQVIGELLLRDLRRLGIRCRLEPAGQGGSAPDCSS
jgi:K+/H+ antiporter YhaU regulatory subunit KhtT